MAIPQPSWLPVATAATVLALGVVTIAGALAEHAFSPMPAIHLVLPPAVVVWYLVLWGLDLVGLAPEQWIFSLVAVIPRLLLGAVGHTGLNTLYLLLLVAWVTYTGSTRASVVALALALGTIAFTAGADALDGRVAVSAWLAWAIGILAIWLMTRALVAQRRLLGELQQAQAELGDQTRRAAILEERQRLARELHDSASQSLYSARMYAEAALRQLAAGHDGEAAGHVQQTRDLVANGVTELRRLIHELRPPALAEQGLMAALQARLATVEGRAGLQTEVSSEPAQLERLPEPVEHELYSVAIEALNNVLKHASARRLTVRLRQQPRTMSVEVADDGIGFEPDGIAGAQPRGLGLVGMRERAERLGGRLDISSSPGHGTRVFLEVPR